MGYKPKKKTYNLDFSGTDLDGLEVSLSGLSTGRLVEMMGLVGVADKNPEAALKLIDWYAEALQEWNVEDDDDQPVKLTRDNVLAQDIEMNLTVIKAWIQAVAGVTEELGKESTSGPRFPVVNLPTELLSSSLPS